MHRLPSEIPQHEIESIKLMAIVHRLQTIMVNENLTPTELVGCAEIVRDNYDKQQADTIRTATMSTIANAVGPKTRFRYWWVEQRATLGVSLFRRDSPQPAL